MPKDKKSRFSIEQRTEADIVIKKFQKQVDYDTKDYTIEYLVDKLAKGDFFIPTYQRQFIWKDQQKSSFIESILLGLPIPFMFFANCDDGRIEIIDGAQRMQTLSSFFKNELKLRGLEKLTVLNGYKFCDLLDSQQRKFIEKTLRIVILEERTPDEVRQDLFNRINTKGTKANFSEIRRGSYPGKFTDFISECTKNELFIELCPIPPKRDARYERFELVLRFFAYTNNYMSFIHNVYSFLDEYLISNLNDFDEDAFRLEFERMLNFVKDNFPCGFAKLPTSTFTPRVRFEAIAVGTALALRENPNLVVHNVDWLQSDEFQELTTSDASNNQSKLRARIEYVRDQLLKR